jgi:hypothetical protein
MLSFDLTIGRYEWAVISIRWASFAMEGNIQWYWFTLFDNAFSHSATPNSTQQLTSSIFLSLQTLEYLSLMHQHLKVRSRGRYGYRTDLHLVGCAASSEPAPTIRMLTCWGLSTYPGNVRQVGSSQHQSGQQSSEYYRYKLVFHSILLEPRALYPQSFTNIAVSPHLRKWVREVTVDSWWGHEWKLFDDPYDTLNATAMLAALRHVCLFWNLKDIHVRFGPTWNGLDACNPDGSQTLQFPLWWHDILNHWFVLLKKLTTFEMGLGCWNHSGRDNA